jgi:general secretion pathway protein B
VSLLAGGGTWFVLYGKSVNSTAVVRQAASLQVVPIVPPVVTPSAPIPVQVVVPEVASSAVPTPVAAVSQENADDSPSSNRVRQPGAPVKPQPVDQKQPVQTVPVPADVKLSGIAWQDERSGRRAVINGFLLKEGAVVSGAKIIDIQADRVRFSSTGGHFEIRLDAVLPAEVK